MNEILVADEIISPEMHKEVYEWGQSVSWYQHWIGVNFSKHYPQQKMVPSISEYNPSLHGQINARHLLGAMSDNMHLKGNEKVTWEDVMKFSLYRHPIGWSDESVQERNPLIWNLWTIINKHFFDGNGTLDGVPETIGGLKGPPIFYVDKENFYKKYNVPETQNHWTCFLNGRCNERPPTRQSKRGGQIHRDTDGTYNGEYYTVLYITNQEWLPEWGGELVYYDEQKTGSTHWKHGWDLGWPSDIVGNKPNRVIVFPHDKTHMTLSPKSDAPEMSQKIAFRCKVI